MSSTIEDTIERVEQLYATITGRQPPSTSGDAMRALPDVEPQRHVDEQLARLTRLIEAIRSRFAVSDVRQPAWQPRAVAWHDATGVDLAIDVPGVAREQLELSVDGNRLVLRGDRVPPWPASERRNRWEPSEVPFGSLSREFTLPFVVEPRQIRARLEHGVLLVRVDHSEHAPPGKVPIQA